MTRSLAARAAAILLFAVSTLLLAGIALAQEQKSPALPLPEMQRLSKLYVGTWTYTETYPKSAYSPNGGVNMGVYTSELGPGGNSIINHFHSKGPVGEFVGVIVMTWDPEAKAYKAFVLGDSFPAAFTETGKWENDTLVYRMEMSVGGKKFVLRNATKFLPGGRLSSDEYSSADGGPEQLLVHVDAVKK